MRIDRGGKCLGKTDPPPPPLFQKEKGFSEFDFSKKGMECIRPGDIYIYGQKMLFPYNRQNTRYILDV
jgi:hypothetical protein